MQLLLNNSEGDLLSGRVLTFARFNRDLAGRADGLSQLLRRFCAVRRPSADRPARAPTPGTHARPDHPQPDRDPPAHPHTRTTIVEISSLAYAYTCVAYYILLSTITIWTPPTDADGPYIIVVSNKTAIILVENFAASAPAAHDRRGTLRPRPFATTSIPHHTRQTIQ